MALLRYVFLTRATWMIADILPKYYSSIPTYENDLKGVSPFLFSAYEYELYVEGKN